MRYFVAINMVVAETKVLSNDDNGHRVSFEVAFKDVSHHLIHSDETLELDPPDSPFLQTFWPPLERDVLDYVPVYRVLKTYGELVNLVDPRLKRTLTALNKRLKRLGVPLNAVDDVQYISSIDRLAGVRIELQYDDGFGVVSIKVLDGLKLPPEDLEALAECSGPMLDYFIFPGAAKKPGETWDVRPQDVASLVRLSYRYTVSGKIQLERDDNDEKGLAVLKVRGGEITALGAAPTLTSTTSWLSIRGSSNTRSRTCSPPRGRCNSDSSNASSAATTCCSARRISAMSRSRRTIGLSERRLRIGTRDEQRRSDLSGLSPLPLPLRAGRGKVLALRVVHCVGYGLSNVSRSATRPEQRCVSGRYPLGPSRRSSMAGWPSTLCWAGR